ncbi:TetR/AcrR family transcriptional regulator [Pseudonocardia sp. GCM10023141]|uniref:TetR/AcrR family transcriptional regulator n=1 Tax=Pseudonocardia sp. GCM10023141 TaxID=3252653 RepID=UPI00360ABE3A
MTTDGRVVRGRTTRDGLVAVARTLFGEHGYDATSIGAVLAAAGVARGALYHHFPSKEALFDAVLEREMARIAEVVGAAARTAGDPVASMRAGCGAWLEVVLDPEVQRIVLRDPPAVLGWARWRELDERYLVRGLQASVRMLAARGRVDPDQADVLAHMVLGAASEAALLVAGAADPEAAMATGRAAIDTLLTRLFEPEPR